VKGAGMSYQIPPADLITPQGIIVAFIVFLAVMLITREETHSKQSWIPALVFAIMAEIAVSIFAKGLI
jgi:hypothetical protein